MEEVEEVGPVLSELKEPILGIGKRKGSRTITKTHNDHLHHSNCNSNNKKNNGSGDGKGKGKGKGKATLRYQQYFRAVHYALFNVFQLFHLFANPKHTSTHHTIPQVFSEPTFQKPLGHYPCEWYSVLHWIWLGVYRSKQSPKCGGNWV